VFDIAESVYCRLMNQFAGANAKSATGMFLWFFNVVFDEYLVFLVISASYSIVPIKKDPNVIDRNLKMDERNVEIFGTKILDAAGHQIAI